MPPTDPTKFIILFWIGEDKILRLSAEHAGSQQSKERIITSAGLAQPGKSYRAVWTGEFN
jgi:hypothetical protein